MLIHDTVDCPVDTVDVRLMTECGKEDHFNYLYVTIIIVN